MLLLKLHLWVDLKTRRLGLFKVQVDLNLIMKLFVIVLNYVLEQSVVCNKGTFKGRRAIAVFCQ